MNSPSVAERRSSSTRASHEIKIDILDLRSEFDHVNFVAGNLDKLPKFGPEEINITYVVQRQVLSEASIREMLSLLRPKFNLGLIKRSYC